MILFEVCAMSRVSMRGWDNIAGKHQGILEWSMKYYFVLAKPQVLFIR